MSKEESSGGVVWVGVGLAVLVVSPVIPGPDVDGVFGRHAVGEHQEHPERGLGFVGTVSPQSVSTSSYTLK